MLHLHYFLLYLVSEKYKQLRHREIKKTFVLIIKKIMEDLDFIYV